MSQSIAKARIGMGILELAGVGYHSYMGIVLLGFRFLPLGPQILLCVGWGYMLLAAVANLCFGIEECRLGRNSINDTSTNEQVLIGVLDLGSSLVGFLLSSIPIILKASLAVTIPFFAAAAVYLISGLINLCVGKTREELLERESQVPRGFNLPGNELNSPKEKSQQPTVAEGGWLRGWLSSSSHDQRAAAPKQAASSQRQQRVAVV